MNTGSRPISKATGMRAKRSNLPAVAAVVGLLLAAAWASASVLHAGAQKETQQRAAQQGAHAIIDLMRAQIQARAVASAQMLAQDPRLQSTLAVRNVDDATILDILKDLQKLNSQALFAVLSPAGRVRVVVGAEKMQGLDLSSSGVVKAALEQEPAALGTWMVDDRVFEVAVVSVRAGDRVVALLAIGNKFDDTALAALAKASRVHLALLVDEKAVWSDAAQPPGTWSAAGVERIEVKGSVPPAHFVAAGIETPDPGAPLVWAVPGLAFLFALLAFWRGGAR